MSSKKYLDKELPHGLAPNFVAPFSGQLSVNAVTESLATLPGALDELRAKWATIDHVRYSGLMPTYDGGPLDDAERGGTWYPDLQVTMPTASGLAGSRGFKQPWPYHFDSSGGNFADNSFSAKHLFDSSLTNNSNGMLKVRTSSLRTIVRQSDGKPSATEIPTIFKSFNQSQNNRPVEI